MLTNENTVRIELTISPDLNDALDLVVATTGTAKASLVRQSIASMLADVGVLAPSAATSIPMSRSTGRLARDKRKEQA